MSVTAEKLSKTGARGKDLQVIIKEHLRIIDDKLCRAEKSWGKNIVTYDLPTLFGIPGLTKTDAQLIIYSAILRSLRDRGFELGLNLEKSILYIVWMTDLNHEEMTAMKKLVSK